MRFFLTGVLLLAPLTVRAASPAAASCGPAVHDIYEAVDQSDSITAGQRLQMEAIAQRVPPAVCPDARLRIFPIHSNTPNTKPLFDDAMPLAPPKGPTMRELLAFKQSVLAFRKGAAEATGQAFRERDTSRATDVFGIFDRINNAGGRDVELIIFSDALHANSELNLEKYRLRKEAFAQVIQKLAARHGWGPQTLSGVVVNFILPSLGDKDLPPGPNDRIILRSFYDVLIRSLGGTPGSFDTQLGGAL